MVIRGCVSDRIEATLEIDVAASPRHSSRRVQLAIDTGFNGHLTLPHEAIESLQLPLAGLREGLLADGNSILLDTFFATVIWHGRARDIVVSQANARPLLGMSLLQGSRLTIDVTPNGDLEIEELP